MCDVLFYYYECIDFVDVFSHQGCTNPMDGLQQKSQMTLEPAVLWASEILLQKIEKLRRNTNMKSLIFLIVCATVAVESRRQVKEYVIDLDKAPEERYLELLPQFNDTVRKRLAHFRYRSFPTFDTKYRSGDFGINTLQRMLF